MLGVPPAEFVVQSVVWHGPRKHCIGDVGVGSSLSRAELYVALDGCIRLCRSSGVRANHTVQHDMCWVYHGQQPCSSAKLRAPAACVIHIL